MRPLLFFGVLYLFFTEILDVGKGVPHYGVYLLTAIVLWNYFAEATGNAVACLVTREPLLRKIRFPRMVIPLSVSLTATFNLGMNMIVVFVFAVLSGVEPTGELAGAHPDHAGAHRVRHRDRDAAVRRLRAVPRRRADLGGARPSLVLPHARSCTSPPAIPSLRRSIGSVTSSSTSR